MVSEKRAAAREDGCQRHEVCIYIRVICSWSANGLQHYLILRRFKGVAEQTGTSRSTPLRVHLSILMAMGVKHIPGRLAPRMCPLPAEASPHFCPHDEPYV